MKNETSLLVAVSNSNVFLFERSPYEQRMLCASLTDEEIAGLAKQNKEYFEFLLERYERKMKIYVRRITGAPNETVEDIVQEVFLKVYSNIDKFDQDMKFSSWIYRIAHNQAVNKFLYEKRRRTESMVYDEKGELRTIVRDKHDIWRKLQQDDINEKLSSALTNISPKYKDVIELNYFDEKSYQEIASQLNKPVNTIGTMLNRGRKMLKKELIKMGVICDVALVQMERDFMFKG